MSTTSQGFSPLRETVPGELPPPEAALLLGELRLAHGDADGAAAAYREAAALRPDWPAPRLNLGVALKRLGRLEEALAACGEALTLQPDWPQALHNRGSLLQALGRPGEALVDYRRAARLAPDWSEAHNSLGHALQALRQLDPAEDAYARALALRPEWHVPYLNLACIATTRGDAESAIRLNREAIRRDPSCRLAHLNLGLLLLQRGDFEEGWREYEWRWGCAGHTPARQGFDQPVWDGSPLGGRTIVLWSEQGLGDTIQFIRYARLVHDRDGVVWVHCPTVLSGLLATCPDVDRVIPAGEAIGDFDVQAPLMSLPRLLGTTLETLPGETPYLSAPVAAPALPSVRTGGRTRVGIVWAANPSHPTAAERSCPPACLQRLADVPGIQLFSLQHGERAADLRALADPRILDLADRLGDFATTAAIVQEMDLVITVDTAMAHLAGALGKPVWLLLPRSADWRWMLDREDSPWYPTLRIFRQGQGDDWQGVAAAVDAALRRL